MYRKFITADGLTGVEVRTWHPGYWVPIWKYKIVYWLGFWKRYESYQDALGTIVEILDMDDESIDYKSANTGIVQCINCGFECDYVELYGFVPEDGCPIHNV